MAGQDGLESSSGSSQGSDDELEEEEAARARRVQGAPGAGKGKGGITGRLADLAVKQARAAPGRIDRVGIRRGLRTKTLCRMRRMGAHRSSCES